MVDRGSVPPFGGTSGGDMPAANTKALTLTDLLFEKAGAGLCLVAPDGTVVRANTEWLRSTGFTEEQALGENVIDLFPETRDMARALHARVRAGHRVEVPRHAQIVNGRGTWWKGSIEPVTMDGGTGLLITAREVTPESEAVRDAAERKRTEDALRENEERLEEYADLLEHAPVLVRDPDDRITVWNEGMERLYGWDREDALGHVSHELLRTRFPQPLVQIRATLELMGRWEGELRHRRRDGSAVNVASIWILHRDRDGKGRAVVEVNTDVTDRRRAEAALHDNEERLRVALDAATFGTFDFDVGTGKAVWDEQQRRIWGIPPDQDVDYAAVLARVHPEDRDATREVFGKALSASSDGLYHAEYRIVRPDGSVRWCSANGRVYFAGEADARRAVRVVGVEADITDRKQAEEALRQSEERFRLLVQGVKEYAIYMVAPDGRVERSWSAAAEHIFGFREEEIVGRNRAILYMEDDRQARRPERDLEKAAEEGPFEEEGWRVRKDGSQFWANVMLTPLRDERGGLRGFANVTRDVTDRRRAEAALRESEGKYVAIHDRAPFGIALTKLPEATFVTANDAFLKMFGFSRDDVIGKTSEELGIADPDAQAVVRGELELRGFLRDFEFTRRTRSGAPIDLSVSIERVTIAGSEYVLTTLQDITGRKRAEEALRTSEERRRLAQQVARTGAFSWDLRSGVNTWTPELEAIYGLPPGGFGGTEAAFEQMIHPEDRDQVRRWVERAMETGAPGEGEWRAIWPDGTIHWIAGRWQAIKDASGTPVRMTGISLDVTQRKTAELALRAQEAELELILGRTPFMLTRCSRDLRYRYVSAAYATMVGRRPEQIAGRPIVEIMGEEGFATIRPYVEAVLRGESVEYEEEVPFSSVGSRRLQVIYVPDHDERGEVVGWLANILDVTEQRQVEALRVANTALLEADRNRTEFLAMLSHELRNPLAPIRNSLYILGRAAPGGEQARHAQTVIERQVGQMTRLIDDLLDVTRVTRGKIRLQREPLDLNELVERTVEDHRTLFSRGQIRLELLTASTKVPVNGDRVRLAQAIGNLLQNAAKFTPGGGTATVSVDADSARGQAVVTVRDTGSGIQPEMLARLFHPFTQADATLDRSKGGLGLGLALVKGLAEMHGGSVTAASAGPGQGAAFTIRIPLDTSSAQSAPPQRPGVPAALPVRVLIVEDNEDAADTLREVLALSDHVVEVAYSGRDGIEKARSFHPDVVLCDIGLPEMDGYDVARKMRADPELSHVALVAVSGYAQPEDVATAREAGFDAHLAKPPSIDALERVLAEIGSVRQIQPAARAPSSPSRA